MMRRKKYLRTDDSSGLEVIHRANCISLPFLGMSLGFNNADSVCLGVLLNAFGGVSVERAKAIVSCDDAQVVVARSIFKEGLVGGSGNHLTEVEWLVGHVVVDDVSASKVEAEKVEREENPGVEDLVLVEDVVVGNVSIVVAVRGNEVETRLTQEVGQHRENGNVANNGPNPSGEQLEEINVIERIGEGDSKEETSELEEEVELDEIRHENLERSVKKLLLVEIWVVLLDRGEEEEGSERIDRGNDTLVSKRSSDSNQTLFNVCVGK